MAYREFHYEKQYDAPDTSQAYAAHVQGITNLFRGMQQRQDQKRKAVDQFAYELDKGAYENDTRILNEVAKNVTTRAKDEIRSTGKLSVETDRLMKDGQAWQAMSKNQFERAKALRQNIVDKGVRDPYYNAEPDLNRVIDATHGKDNDIDFRVRGERLAQAEQSIGAIDTFKFDKYRADYLKQIGTQSKEREFPNKDGSSKTVYDQSVFWNGAKPGVTNDHAIRYIESDKRVSEYYDDKVSNRLDDEIKSMKSSGDTRADWMKGKSNAEIKTMLINEPSKNFVNNQDYGVRVRDLAKADLAEADRVNSKVSYTSMQRDLNNSGGRWKNPNVLHEDSINSFAQEAKSEETGQMSAVSTYGPGGRFALKSGKPLQINTTNPVRTDIIRGLTTRNNKGTLNFNMTGYQLMPVRAGMAPFALKSPTTEGMIKEINEMPLDYFDPAGKMKLQPEMKIGLKGFTINETGVLNDIRDQLLDLSSQIHAAEISGNKDKQDSLEAMEDKLNRLNETIGAGEYDPTDLLISANKSGVRKIQQEWIIPADDSDFAEINSKSSGFNLKDKSYWSPDMTAVQDAYTKRAEEAKAQGYGKQTTPEQPKKEMPLKTSYKVNGKDYSVGDLKKLGYTDDQIKEAVRLGNIK